jgi:hypothetical protein
MVIAGLIVKMARVEVSWTESVEVSENVTIARKRYLFIDVVNATVVNVSVVPPVPDETFVQPVTPVAVSVVNCHCTDLVRGAGAAFVVTVNVSTIPAVVVSDKG